MGKGVKMFLQFFCLLFSAFNPAAHAKIELARTISFGRTITENGIHICANADGQYATALRGGQYCAEMRPGGSSSSAYLYFAVDDSFMYNNAQDVFVTVEYFDQGTAAFYLQYDGPGGPYSDGGRQLRTASNVWTRQTFVLATTGFTNRQNGAADFRLAVADTGNALLAVKNIWVWIAPGSFIAPRQTDFSGTSYKADDDVVFTYYFYWYDVSTGMHIWDDAQQKDDALQDHPASMIDFSYTSVAWHKRELEEIMAAGIDVILPIYWGSSSEMETWSVLGLQKLVEAELELLDEGKQPPRIGMFFDTSTLSYGERILKSADGQTDLSTSFGQAFFFKHVRDFYSLIPPALWARIDNQPVVWLYAAGFAKNQTQSLITFVNERFSASFGGLQPYIVREGSWTLNTQNDYAWGAALSGAQIQGVAGVGPGYNDSAVPGRTTPVRDRENGNFYRRAWNAALGSGRNFVVVETWNELHEGTDICHSREYGRQYIQLTAEFSRMHKQATKWSYFQPQSWINNPHPTCRVQVQDKRNGLQPASVQCRYTDDNGVTWHSWPSTCSGVAGSKNLEIIEALSIPFNSGAGPLSTPNQVQFVIHNAGGDSSVSPIFYVFCGAPPAFAAGISLGTAASSYGVQQRFQRNDDGWSGETVISGVPCSYNLVKNASPYPGRYLYFNVVDSLMLAGSSRELWLTVAYYDTAATGSFELQYDSPGSALANWYKSGGSTNVGNTRKWKSKTYHLTDAWFANRENGGSDFRIYTGGVLFVSRITVSNREATAVEQVYGETHRSRPEGFGLQQNYPNPFNQSTEIQYQLDREGWVSLAVYDLAGRQVHKLLNEFQVAGEHRQRWDGSSEQGPAASGIYFIKLMQGEQVSVRRLLLLR
jgi:hypothetical protein